MNHLLELKQISHFFYWKNQKIDILQSISLTIPAGTIIGVGGESGCGKSTLAKIAVGLIEPMAGSVSLEGEPLSKWIRGNSHKWRQKLQMVFQHAGFSLNPRMRVKEIVAEPLIIQEVGHPRERENAVSEIVEQVGLSLDFLDRYPEELSGGQKQRVALARALILNPSLLICDEPFASLDASAEAQLINLLLKWHQEKQSAFLMISHNLSLLRFFSDFLLILYMGERMEWGPAAAVAKTPLHPYSQLLIASQLPLLPIKKEPLSLHVEEKPVHSSHKRSGCPFQARCPYAMPICQTEKPIWQEVAKGHFTACHLYR